MDLERIVENLMVSDTEAIQKATKEFEEAISRADTIIGLFNIMTGHAKPTNRQFAAILLKKHLGKLRNYHQVPTEALQYMKSNIVNAIFTENQNIVRSGSIQFLGVILRHESHNDDAWITEVVNYILNQCCSNDPQAVDIGTFVFAKLADVSPALFIEKFQSVRNIFQVTLLSAEGSSTNIPAVVRHNILTAMAALVPQILGSTEAEQTFQAAVPHLVHISAKFAAEGQIEHFTIALDVLQNMVEFTPLLLNPHVRLLMEFAFSVSSNKSYDPEIRIKALNFVCSMISEKKKMILKLKLIEPIMSVVFNIMASEPESDDADEFFVESEVETPLGSATIVIDTLATKMPPEKFIPPLLTLLEPALNNIGDELRRRAAYIVIASISEGCKEAICDKYLEPMLNILKQGLNDHVVSVRNAALFAIGQFSEQLQPEITDYANDVLPLLLQQVQNIIHAYQTGQTVDVKSTERVFYALEAFCNSMKESLEPYLENLMCMVLTFLSNNYAVELKILAMQLTEVAAAAYKGSLLPWFQQLIDRLRPLLLQDDEIDADGLRSQAINTLAAIAKNADKHFLPFAPETMQQCAVWIAGTDDIDVRKSLINMFGALGSVVGDNLLPVLPTVLEHIHRCIDEGTELVPALVPTEGSNDAKNTDNDDEIDLNDESIASSESQFFGDNPYLEAKIQSIQTLQELSESCMKILLPYAQNLFETLFKLLDHVAVDVRRYAITAATTFAIKWIECEPEDKAKQALHILLQKLVQIVRKDHKSEIVIEAQDAISDILTDVGCIALSTKQMRDSIATCIKEGLTYELMCLFTGEDSDDDSQDEDDCETDAYVIEGAANLLTSLGKAVSPDEFAEYFKLLEPYIMKHLNNSNEGEMQIERGYLIGVLAECYGPLGKNVAPHFVKHYKILIRATKRRNSKTRQNAVYGLGELMRAGNEISYSYFPDVLENLSSLIVNEKKQPVIDNIMGALARLILTNASLVPLEQVIPAMLQKLPIVDDKVENIVVMECFEFLYTQIPQNMQAHAQSIIAIAIQSIATVVCEPDLVEQVIKLVHKIRSIYPEDYQVAMTNLTVAAMLPKAQEQANGQL